VDCFPDSEADVGVVSPTQILVLGLFVRLRSQLRACFPDSDYGCGLVSLNQDVFMNVSPTQILVLGVFPRLRS
jgi:hypothetical protein